MLAINKDSLALAKKLIACGEIVAFPTETVYGLGADVFCVDAVQKIFLAKGRPQDNPLIVHIAKPDDLYRVASHVSEDVKKLFALMPSSLTVVVPKKPTVPDIVTAGLDSVAVRCPRSQEARDFIAATDTLICAPSANISGRPSPTSAEAVYRDMAGRIPLILAGRDCDVGIESTVLSMCDTPTILRPGIVTKSLIESVLGRQVEVLSDPSSRVNSPGVRYRHYAPSCPCVLYQKEQLALALQRYDTERLLNNNPVILCKNQDCAKFALTKCNVMDLGDSDTQAAHNYYAYLGIAERQYGCIIIYYSPSGQVGESLLNRMQKSCGVGKV